MTLLPDWEERPSCALDLAQQGGLTGEEVGAVLRVSKQAVQVIQTRAMKKLRVIWESGHEDP